MPAPAGSRRRIDRTYDALDLRPVERWIESKAAAEGLRIEQRLVEERDEAYLDTEDRRLFRAGLCLRLTEGDGGQIASLESIDPASTVSHRSTEPRREEFENDALPSLEASEDLFGGSLWSLKGPRPLGVRVEVHSRIRGIELRAASGTVWDIVLEETTIPLGEGETPARLNRVSIGSDTGDSAESSAFTEELELACALRSSTLTRFQAAVATLGIERPVPPDLGVARVERSHTVAEAAYAVLRKHLKRMLVEEPGTRLGADIEALHDMRVAVRRMRAAMRLFRDYLPSRIAGVNRELKWVGGVLGEVRDLDVHLATLAEWKTELDPQDGPALDRLRDWLDQRRVVARRRMIRSLDTRRYERLVERITSILRGGPPRRFAPGRAPVLSEAPELIGGRYDRVVKLGRKIDKHSPPDMYHRLRIRCKALRYALEFHGGLYGKAAQRMVDNLVELQDLLGEHQDAEVAVAWLRDLMQRRRRRLAPDTAFVAGKLVERYQRTARRLRARFPRRFDPITGKVWHRLHQIMSRSAGLRAERPSRA